MSQSLATGSIALSLVLAGGDWYVDASADCESGNGTKEEPFCTIMEAVGVASNGDTIRIAPGTYRENVDLDKDLALLGTQGRSVTIVDGGGSGSVATLREGTTIEIVGLTLTNGDNGAYGDGIRLEGSTPMTLVLRNSSVDGNRGGTSFGAVGGGIYNPASGTVALLDSTVSGNWIGGQSAFGAGIHNRGTMTLVDSEIADNTTFGSYEFGSAIWSQGQLSMTNCTLAGNTASYPYVAVIDTISGSRTCIESSIVWGNTYTFFSGGLSTPIRGPDVTVNDSDIQLGWTGAGSGNIALDPLFNDTVGGDYSLQPASPCIDAGAPSALPTGLDQAGNPRLLDGDLDGVMRVDMGAHEFDHVTLAVTGTPEPGGTLVVSASGTPGLSLLLGVGRPPGETLFAPWGSLFFDLNEPLRVCAFGTSPNTQSFTLPPTLSGPIDFVLQALALAPSGGPPRPGNFSNPVHLTVE